MLRFISNWSVIAALVIGLLCITRIKKDAVLTVCIILAASVPQLFNSLFKDSPWRDITYNVYTPVEFILVALLFHKKYSVQLFRLIFNGSLILYIIASSVVLYFKKITLFIPEWVCVNNFFYLVWILQYMVERVIEDDVKFKLTSPFSIFIMALVIYSCDTILYFSLSDYLSAKFPSVLHKFEIMHDINNILLYLLFSIGIFIDAYKGERQTA